MITSRVSRLAWSKSNPGCIVPLCHNSAPAASIFQPDGGLRQIRHTKSEQLQEMTLALSNLTGGSGVQLSLLAEVRHDRKQRLAEAERQPE